MFKALLPTIRALPVGELWTEVFSQVPCSLPHSHTDWSFSVRKSVFFCLPKSSVRLHRPLINKRFAKSSAVFAILVVKKIGEYGVSRVLKVI